MLDHSRQSRSVLPGPFAHIIDQRAHSGIGKTMFLHYMTWRLRQIPSVTSIILERVRWDFSRPGPRASAVSSRVATRCTKHKPVGPLRQHHGGPADRSLAGGACHVPKVRRAAFSSSFGVADPDDARLSVWQQFNKQENARKFVMPVWGYSELQACHRVCFPDVPQPSVDQNFHRW